MDCLQNYIGLRQVSTAPISGLWINALPGMSTELADRIATEEQLNYVGVWADVQSNAFRRIQEDVVNLLSTDVKINQIVYQTHRPKVYRNQPAILADTNYRGVIVQVPVSKYVTFRLREVYIYSTSIVATTLKTFASQNINLVVGLNTIPVNVNYSLTKFGGINLFIGVDGSDFDSISFFPEYYDFYDCHNNCHSGISNFNGQPDYIVMEPAEIGLSEDMDFDNLTKFADGRGIAIGAEINCSVEEFICQNRKSFDSSLLYLLGSEMLFMKLGSPRLNYLASSNLELTQLTRNEFEKKYLSSLQKALDSIPLHGDSLCFECAETAFVSHKYTDV
jgi:hypothetical protein